MPRISSLLYSLLQRAVTGIVFLSCLPSSAAHAATGCEPLPGQITPNVQWPQVWQALTDGSNCTQNCHVGQNATADLDLSSRMLSIYSLVSQDSSQSNTVKRVVAGNARASLFLQKINCTTPDVGSRMPPGGHVPAALQALVYDWIEQGAYGEDPNDPVARDFIFKDGAESTR
jgi:hypothetical protein